MIPPNTVITPFCLFDKLKSRYKSKNVISDVHCENDRYYYTNVKGELRTIIENKIYTPILDEDGFPTTKLKMIR